MTGVFMGVLLGLCTALAVALYLIKTPSPVVPREKVLDKASPASKPVAGLPRSQPPIAGLPARSPPEAKTRFDFYDILPGKEEAVQEQELRAARSSGEPPVYYLQAGAFQNSSDADNLKARLALAGLEAQIQTATLPDNAVWHRVRLGPYSGVEQLEKARATLRENKIEPRVVKLIEREPR
jgi:cell division protein FtsN